MEVNMEFKFLTNKQKIVESGSVILYNYDSDWTVNVKANDDFEFSIVVKFKVNPDEEKQIGRKVADNKVELTCVNFDNTMGSGTVVPIEIATINNKKLSLHLWVYSLGKKEGRRLEYTFLLEE